jgi:WD40 repeat protein/uncharacterized caspase-like protein
MKLIHQKTVGPLARALCFIAATAAFAQTQQANVGQDCSNSKFERIVAGRAAQPARVALLARSTLPETAQPWLVAPPFLSHKLSSEKPELILQTGHSQKSEGLAFSPDGRYVATGSVDHTIKLWEVATGRELRTLTGHTGTVKAVAFSPDGQTLASGGNDGKIKFWEIASGREAASLAGHAQSVIALAFSHDGRWLASSGADFAVKLWEVASRREARSYTGHFGLAPALAFSPDGSLLASGSRDKTIRLWNVSPAREREPLEHTGEVRSVAFSPDGKTLAAAGHDGKVWLWSLPKARRVKKPGVAPSGLLAAGFSRDGSKLLTCAEDRTIRIFNPVTLVEISALPDSAGFEKYETAAFSSDSSWVLGSIGLPAVDLRQTIPGSRVRTLENRNNPVYSVAVSPDGRWLATGNKDTTITVWDLFSGRVVASLAGNAGSVGAVAFSPDSGRLASGAKGGMIILWDIAAGRELHRWPAHPDGVNSLVFAQDGRRLISSGVEPVIRVWETETGNEMATMTGHTKEARALSLSADGKQMASAGADQTVRVWDTGSNSAAEPLAGHTGSVFAVAMSADGRLIASGGADRLVKLWDAGAGREIHSLAGLQGRVDSLAFSPDGRYLAAGGATGEIKVWETQSGAAAFTLVGHEGGVNALCFGPGGKWLISGSEDGSARFWEVEKGVLAATVISLRNNSDWLVVAPDGLFDGSPAAWNQILWRFAQNTFSAAPVEIFFNEFFHPDLLADVVAHRRPRAVEDISLRDRRQPLVRMAVEGGSQSTTSTTSAGRTITVNLEVAESPPDGDHAKGSGAHDVRLFRNGSLVKFWRGDAIRGQGGAVKLQHTLPLVAGENRLTAYAFNRDNVKSADETLTVTGGDNLARQGTLYVLAVGVNQYANQEFNLKFAVADATAFSDEAQQQQLRLKRFARTEVVKLLDREATKANLLAALKRLAGGEAVAGAPAEMEKLQPAQPEDAVIVYFSGHGVALESRFYILPHDLGYRGLRNDVDEEGLRQLIASSVSDLELEEHFENVDAGHLVFIIDACDSGQALDTDREKRRGPMNSKGLAQLAYEKGMNILTAAQSYQAAWENSQIGHGYLTYALVVSGIRNLAADYNPRDGQVLLREWLDHAAAEVPRMQESKSDKDRGIKLGGENKPAGETRVAGEIKLKREIQRPRVFYRREAETRQLIIAKP